MINMKILNLRFNNLNSLYGEWEIDFTTDEYISDGIFAVTGPTGSGKSTILDAICLALYGRTPRLEKVNNSGNEIMSRQTGECFAEVTFETMSGKYCCQWSQHRARKKADGKLAVAKHEISDARTGDLIASKKREVAENVEKVTGMDFDRFTRSMLLAQGGFAAFLQADSDERAPILEQMTGTEIYTDISKMVHEKHSKEVEALKLLKAETAGIVILTEEEETELAEGLVGKEAEEKTHSKVDEAVKKAIQWLRGIDTLNNELIKINQESEESTKQLVAFKPNREKLRKAQKAAGIESEHVALQSMRKEQSNDKTTLEASVKLQPDIEEDLKQKDVALKSEKESLATQRAAQVKEQELTKQVRKLDTKIFGKCDDLKTVTAEQQNIEKEIKSQLKILKQTKTKKKEVEKKALVATAYLAENKNDSNLLAALTGIKEQINNYQTTDKKESSAKSAQKSGNQLVKTATAAYKKKQNACEDLKEKHKISVQQVATVKVLIEKLLDGNLLREHREKHESLLREQGLINKINSLEEERVNLEDNKACPLCGSLQHPYAEGNIPAVGEIEKQINALATLIKNIEDEEIKLKSAEDGEKSAKENLTEANNSLVKLESKRDQAIKDLDHTKGELESANDQCETIGQKIISQILPFGITELPQNKPSSIYDALKVRSDKWQECNTLSANSKISSDELNAEINKIIAIIETYNKSLNSKNSIKLAHKNDFDQYTAKRKDLYADKDPDGEEKKIAEIIHKLEETIERSTVNRDNTAHKSTELKSRIKSLKEDIAKRSPHLTNAETSFISSCKKAEFDDEQMFAACLLPQDEKAQLIQKEKEVDSKKADIDTRKKDREAKLKDETAKKVTEESLGNLIASQTETQALLSSLRENIGATKEKQSNNTKAKESIKEKQAQIDSQSRECIRWTNLHSLIGSADGKKYRNFAQGLTFEIMVSHANNQLCKMSSRYLLVRDKEQPLELNVIDNYQAGEVRSTKNLSGGESFIISLSLALGLSKMASRKVRVDSLFLDEGFGTLDEDALDIALNTLAALQQDGKLIGVISHVATLKERINTQINIIPATGGKSTITGPGCSRK